MTVMILCKHYGIPEVCHPCCVCENWKGYVVIHNYVNKGVFNGYNIQLHVE